MPGDRIKVEHQPHASDRCGAKTRTGEPCKNRPVTGRKRCRMHGGAARSGAPTGNQNALKHGYYSMESRNNRRLARIIAKQRREEIEQLFRLAEHYWKDPA